MSCGCWHDTQHNPVAPEGPNAAAAHRDRDEGEYKTDVQVLQDMFAAAPKPVRTDHDRDHDHDVQSFSYS